MSLSGVLTVGHETLGRSIFIRGVQPRGLDLVFSVCLPADRYARVNLATCPEGVEGVAERLRKEGFEVQVMRSSWGMFRV